MFQNVDDSRLVSIRFFDGADPDIRDDYLKLIEAKL